MSINDDLDVTVIALDTKRGQPQAPAFRTKV